MAIGQAIQAGRNQGSRTLVPELQPPFSKRLSLLEFNHKMYFINHILSILGERILASARGRNQRQIECDNALLFAKLMIPRFCLKTVHPASIGGKFL
jgi:hypothetical protein